MNITARFKRRLLCVVRYQLKLYKPFELLNGSKILNLAQINGNTDYTYSLVFCNTNVTNYY
jgi:hypothetical protein